LVKALNTVWYQKWFVHLRPRPEAIGGRVHLIKTGQQDKTSVKLSPVILNSQGLQQSFNKYGIWLLSQAFPEGSPAHPSYPTGHGVGDCITVLKFFFDGSFVVPNPVVSSSDGLSLVLYTGADAGQLNSEWRTQHAGTQRQLRPRHPRRHSLPRPTRTHLYY
jgi:hypothetical protein